MHHGLRGMDAPGSAPFPLIAYKYIIQTTVLPNLCVSSHKCAARALDMCCGRMSEMRRFKLQLHVYHSIRTCDIPRRQIDAVKCNF